LTKSWLLRNNRSKLRLESWSMFNCKQNPTFYCSRSGLVWDLCLLGFPWSVLHFSMFDLFCLKGFYVFVKVNLFWFRVFVLVYFWVNPVGLKLGQSLGFVWFKGVFEKHFLSLFWVTFTSKKKLFLLAKYGLTKIT
jgi:hypothetical protein